MYIQRKTKALSCNYCCRKKAITVTYSEYVSAASLIQHSMRMRHVIFCHLWPVWLYHIFSTLSHKEYFLRNKISEHNIYVLTFSIAFVCNISHSKKISARYYKTTHLFHTT